MVAPIAAMANGKIQYMGMVSLLRNVNVNKYVVSTNNGIAKASRFSPLISNFKSVCSLGIFVGINSVANTFMGV